MKKQIHITPKGIALIAAIDVGWVQKEADASYITQDFEKFWTMFTKQVDVLLKEDK